MKEVSRIEENCGEKWNVVQFPSSSFAVSWRLWTCHEQNWYIWFGI